VAAPVKALNLWMTTEAKSVILGNPDTRQFAYLIFINVLHGLQDLRHSA